MASELIIFDIDGTLLDSRERYYKCMDFAFRNYGPSDEIKKIISVSFGKTAIDLIHNIGITKESEIDVILTDICSFLKDSAIRSDIFPGVEEMLRSLRKICRIAIATSRKLDEVSIDPDIKPLLGYIDYISTTEIGMAPKPAPDIIVKALDAFSISASRAVYIGDTELDMKCAKSAGMHFILAGWNKYALENVRTDPDVIISRRTEDIINYL